MNEFYIIGQQLPIKRKVKNKITGNIKEYEGYEVVNGTFFLCFDNKFLPKLIYEEIEDMCDFCKGKNVCKTAYGEFRIKKIGYMDVLQCSVDKCPPHSQCCNKEMNVEMAMQIAFCPMCGRKLVEND